MVLALQAGLESLLNFQYSLCRVVLMVPHREEVDPRTDHLSVLALSSRFDGRCWI